MTLPHDAQPCVLPDERHRPEREVAPRLRVRPRWSTGGGVTEPLSMRVAIGTSLAIITATPALALTAHLLTGRGLDIPVTPAMTVRALRSL